MTAPMHAAADEIASLQAAPFDHLPAEVALRAFGVNYGHVRTADGGDLYVTRFGWPFLRHLLPENWYADEHYARAGEKLPGSTGTVYRVPTRPVDDYSIDLVVKFSRIAQEVPLEIATSFPDNVSADDIANARFNGPLEEFGLLMELRRGSYGPDDIRLRAQRPLAVFAPAEPHELWRLGRSRHSFSAHQRRLAADQETAPLAIALDIKREYVLLYGWIKGHNAEDALEVGQIDEHGLRALTIRVTGELRAKGFHVLDNKPKHFIVRSHPCSGKLKERHGELVYALVDFELLQRTSAYQQQYQAAQRARYWQLQSRRLDRPTRPLPPHLKQVSIFNVNYLCGTAPNGGEIWAVGNNPDLFDYFLPDRWRRTPRVQMSLANEVYYTRTRDNIHVVYRRSRVGQRPGVDPFYDEGKRIREHGYNSPFEEVAIAEHLRRQGINAAYPRAIYRTAHESTKAGYLRDESRYASHREMLTFDADAELILSPHHDYYTIWGYWRGIDPQKDYRGHGHWGFVDVAKACDDLLINRNEHDHVVAATRRRLAAAGLPDELLDDYALLLLFDDDGTALRRDRRGELEVVLCLDALTAYDHKLLDEQAYRDILESTNQKLLSVGCEALNLSGNHLLMSMNPDGQFRTDSQNRYEITVCNTELIRMTNRRLW